MCTKSYRTKERVSGSGAGESGELCASGSSSCASGWTNRNRSIHCAERFLRLATRRAGKVQHGDAALMNNAITSLLIFHGMLPSWLSVSLAADALSDAARIYLVFCSGPVFNNNKRLKIFKKNCMHFRSKCLFRWTGLPFTFPHRIPRRLFPDKLLLSFSRFSSAADRSTLNFRFSSCSAPDCFAASRTKMPMPSRMSIERWHRNVR